jgi:hypothetical protein
MRALLLLPLAGCAVVDAVTGGPQRLETCQASIDLSFSVAEIPSSLITAQVDAIGVGDFDNDMHADLVLVSGTEVTFLYGDGGQMGLAHGGVVAGPQTINVGGGAPSDIVVADFDGDGTSDAAILMVNPPRVEVIRGRTDRAITSSNKLDGIPANAIAVGPVLHTQPDLVIVGGSEPSTMRIMSWNNTAFVPTTGEALADPVSVSVGDVDGDGASDIAFSHAGAIDISTHMAMNDLNVNIQTGSASPQVLVGHIGAEVHGDIFTVQPSDGGAEVRLYLTNGSSGGQVDSFEMIADGLVGGDGISVTGRARLDDLDGDHVDDLLLPGTQVNSSGSVQLFVARHLDSGGPCMSFVGTGATQSGRAVATGRAVDGHFVAIAHDQGVRVLLFQQ